MGLLELLLQYTLYGLLKGSIYALIGMGVTLVYGIMRLINFAQGDLFMLGAYGAYFGVILLGLHPVAAVLLSGLIVFVLSALMEKGMIFPIRTRAVEEMKAGGMIATLGASVLLEQTAILLWGNEYRGVSYMKGSVDLGGIIVGYDRVFALVAAVLTTAALWVFLKKTRVGLAIRAVAQNLEGAKILGVATDTIYTITFALGGMLSGLAGALLLPIFLAYPAVGTFPASMAFAAVVLGGLGAVEGAIVAGFLLGLAGAYCVGFVGASWEPLIAFVAVIVVLLIRPAGLFGEKVRT